MITIKEKITEIDSYLELPPEWGMKVSKHDYSYSNERIWTVNVFNKKGYDTLEEVTRHHSCRSEAIALAVRAACVVEQALKDAGLSA